MSKALQVYDRIEEKVVDIPEDEVESVQNTRRIYFGIQQKVFEASTVGTVANISVRSFITGLLRYGKWQVENGLKQNPKHGEFPERIWEIIENKVIDIAEEITNSEDDRVAIAKFKKPYKQLSDAEKKTLDCKTCDSAEPTRIIRDPIKTLKIKRCKNCKTYEIEL